MANVDIGAGLSPEDLRKLQGMFAGYENSADGHGGTPFGSTPEDIQASFSAALQSNPQFQGQRQELARRTEEGTQALSPAQYAQYQQNAATNSRYGSDMSWLDPSFQYSPALLGQSAGSLAGADPNSVAAQNAAMTQAQQFANTNLQFQSPAQQQALAQQWAGVQNGQGAPSFMGNSQQQGLMQQLLGVQAPQFESSAQQQSALNRLNGVQAAQFSGDADQRAVLNQALGLASNTGPGSLQFDQSGRQAEQYGNLQGIIAGGGADAIEMARRQAGRADSEAWLRGQREADMADYAERGLTGSGMELLNLSSDRQAAAQRNSMSDLQTAAALEERRLGAINSASGLATNMRGQTIDEQGLLNSRATAGLGAASSVANSMRDANIQEQMFLNTSARDQAAQAAAIAGQMRGQTAQEQLGLNSALQNQFSSAAQIAGQMRGQDYNEQSYLDQRGINALTQQTGLSNTMRDQQANEQIANRSAQQAALGTLASTATNARGQSAQESQYRAGAADEFVRLNQSAINGAQSANTNFLQNSYQQMMNNRQQWEMQMAQLGLSTAGGLLGSDVQENQFQSREGQVLASNNAATRNTAGSEMRNDLIGAANAGNAGVNAAAAQSNLLYPQIGAWVGDVAGTVATYGINQASSPSGGGQGGSLPTAPATNLSAPTGGGNPYGVGVGGGATGGNPYGVSVTGTRQGSFLPANYDISRLRV